MPNTEIVPFAFDEVSVRTVVIDGGPWWVASDVARALNISNGRQATNRLDPEGVSQTDIPTSGGVQSVTIINESALYELVIRSDKPEAARFRRWITNEVLPAIRKTGTYSVAAKSELDIIRDQHRSISLLLEANEDAQARAVQAEQTVDFIEGSEGLSVEEFHKQYFCDVPAMRFNQFLYEKQLLVNQLRARGRDSKGRWKNGKQHRYPTFRGKAFFFLDPSVDRETGERHYQTKVRPGRPEVDLVAYLTDRGLPSNGNAPRTLKAVTA